MLSHSGHPLITFTIHRETWIIPVDLEIIIRIHRHQNGYQTEISHWLEDSIETQIQINKNRSKNFLTDG